MYNTYIIYAFKIHFLYIFKFQAFLKIPTLLYIQNFKALSFQIFPEFSSLKNSYIIPAFKIWCSLSSFSC